MVGGNAAHVLIFSNDRKKILLTKRKDIPMWVLPGGHLDKNETFKVAAVREYKEETGLTIRILHLLALYKTPDNNIEKRVYEGKIISGKIKETNEAKQIKWFPITALPVLMTRYERIRISDGLSYNGKFRTKPLNFDIKQELLFQIRNPYRFLTFLFYYLFNLHNKHK